MAGKPSGVDETMHGPKWKWEWSPNSIIMVVGFAGSLIAYGYAYADLVTATAANSSEIGKLWLEAKRIDADTRRFENLEYRVRIVEGQARDSIVALRDTTLAISQLASDVRVAREILGRLEVTLAGRRLKP